MAHNAAQLKRSARLVLAILLALLPVSVWQTAGWREDEARSTLLQEGRAKLALYRANLLGALKEYEYLPITLAADAEILALVDAPNPAMVEAANVYLEAQARRSGASDLYFMNQDGLTVAASNWNGDTSFIGRNFRFRPYFQQAFGGATGRYFALGTTSNLPGYYISHPVRINGRIRGVMVAKISLTTLEESWRKGGEKVLVADENDVAIITSDPGWKFRALSPMDAQQRAWLKRTLKYADAPLAAMEILTGAFPSQDNVLARVTLRAPTPPGAPRPEVLRTAPFLVQGLSIDSHDWRLYLLSEASVLSRARWDGGLVAGALHGLAALGIYLVLHRRRALLERIELQNWSQAELERQVRLRTADLMTTNLRLADEIKVRRQTEADLHAAQAELVQAGKLAALGQMSAGIAHEINQPLTAIRSYAENALRFLERDRQEIAQRNLDRILNLTGRMAHITAHLKSFARRADAVVDPVDPIGCIDAALDVLRAGQRLDRVEIRTSYADPPPAVLAETTQLEQVLINLIGNALDAMAGQPSRRLRLSVAETGAQSVNITVADNGPGIAEDHLERIFDPFFTTKPTGDGLGLGLSICYGIVRGFGGRLTAENRLRGGAAFTVSLRRAALAPGDRHHDTLPAAPNRRKTG